MSSYSVFHFFIVSSFFKAMWLQFAIVPIVAFVIYDRIYANGHGLELLQAYMQLYGWPIVFSLILLYNIHPYVKDFMAKLSLKHAMRKERTDVLDAEVNRIRSEQQEEHMRRVREAKLNEQKERKVKGTSKSEEEKKASAEALKNLIQKHKRDNPSKFGLDNSRSRGGVQPSRRRGG